MAVMMAATHGKSARQIILFLFKAVPLALALSDSLCRPMVLASVMVTRCDDDGDGDGMVKVVVDGSC